MAYGYTEIYKLIVRLTQMPKRAIQGWLIIVLLNSYLFMFSIIIIIIIIIIIVVVVVVVVVVVYL